ncbi:SPOSA6832_01594, partial [Sporobolomyces salmonicolor]
MAEEILARTTAGREAAKAKQDHAKHGGDGHAPSPPLVALPSAQGLVVPGPASTGATTPSTAPSTPNLVSSTVATPGTSRTTTPANQGSGSGAATVARPPPPAQPMSYQGSYQSSAPSTKKGSATGEGAAKEKKSMFGKLFDRDRNSSSVSIASSAAMDRGGSGSGASEPGAGAHLNGLAAAGPPLARRTSGKKDKEQAKEDKEREKREKKEREKRDKEEREAQKAVAGRARSASRGRTPSQTGRPRSDSHGAKEKEGGGGGGGLGQAMDFMRIKVQRKTSVTSRKSDDGRSEKDVDEGRSQYGGSTKEETKSRGGRSDASLNKKYGVCDKVIVGKGATAVVRLAHKWDRSTERLYAVKEFRKRRKNETEKEYVKKLTSEFCISSTLHHHNIVETVDLVQDEQQHWCEVMEYCPGGDLYAAIKKGDLGPAEINSYFKQILAGIAYLHSMGVAHRDIKPENLLLDAKGHVKITDFGVSDVFRMCWEKTTHLSKGLCGSEPYIAPEQFEHKEYDARLVDVWAAAVVFYCMHFQELPWRVAKPSDPSFGPYLQLYSTSSSTPAPLSNLVPRECRSIIRRMLDPDPKTRATTEQIIADPWFAKIEVIPPIEGILPPVPTLP